MAPPPAVQNTKKKKKGHSPAHQNATAWRHNPKSKKTDKILASPISNVCRRCHQKLEWRKQYRKYKPRTVLGKCNVCQRKNITAAYHTICDDCSCGRIVMIAASGENDTTQTISKVTQLLEELQCQRICCICVKEPALTGSGSTGGEDRDGTEDQQVANAPPLLRLRQLKTLERQKNQPTKRKQQSSKRLDDVATDNCDDNEKDVDDDKSDCDLDLSGQDDAASSSDSAHDRHDFDNDSSLDDEDEDNDPFLRAVGGADQLLVGEAYQQRQLQLQVLQNQTSNRAGANQKEQTG